MKRDGAFNEVMIVNPTNFNKGARLMYYDPEMAAMGYFAEYPGYEDYMGEEPGYYYGEDPYLSEEEYLYGLGNPYGYYGQLPEMVGWREPYGYYGGIEPGYGIGYFAEDIPGDYYGYYGEDDDYYGEDDDYPVSEYYEEEPVGYFAEDFPNDYGYYGEDSYESDYGEYEPELDEYGEMDYETEPGMAGYVQEKEPTFNARCGFPTNVSGLGEEDEFAENDDELEGYVRPSTVNPACGQFKPQPRTRATEPEYFKPLW